MADRTSTMPKGWKMTTLGEVADVQTGPFGSQLHNEDYVKTGTPIITVENLLNNSIEYTKDTPKVSDKDKDRLQKYTLRKGDIVFSRVGSVDRCGFVSERENGWLFSGRLLRVRPQEVLFDKYVFYWIIQESIKEFVRKIAVGATMPSINTDLLSQVPISFPPLPEQRAIAAVLSSLDDKIELLREQNKTLEATAQAIFKEWFVNFNFLGATGKMIDSELGKIPKGWRAGKIKDLINIFSGFAFSSSDFSQTGKYKLVTIKNVQDRHFDQEIKDTLDDLPSKMPSYCNLKTGDILLSLTGNVGRICLVVGENYLLNQRVAKLEPINAKDYAFSYLLFLQDSIFSLLQSTASGTAQQNLSPVLTKEIEIIVPIRKTLDEFGAIANPIISKVNWNNSQIQTLSKLRDTLLPKLMSGEIRL